MKRVAKILLCLLAVLLLAAAAVAVYIVTRPAPDYVATESELTVAAATLYNDFKKSEIAAAKRYAGRVIRVEGRVDALEGTGPETAVCFYFEEGFFGPEGVRCVLEPGDAALPAAGDNVVIKGYCTGFTGADVVLEHAVVVP